VKAVRKLTYVAGIVDANPASVVRVPIRYIVMDFVQGTTLAQRKSPKGYYYRKDIEAVATAVQRLTDIKMPVGTAPGPVGGGYIGHDFFVDCLSALEYPTVGHLEAQIIEICFPLAFGTSH
jgi:hypothetical protein